MSESLKQQRVLAIKLRQLGDTVLMTPSLRVLKELEPTSNIDVMVNASSGPLLAHLSFVANTIAISEPKGLFRRLGFWWDTIKIARTRGYSKVLVFHGSLKLALVAKLIARGRGIAVTNYHELKPSLLTRMLLALMSDRKVPGRGVLKPNSDRDLDVLRAMGINVLSSHASRTQLAVTKDEQERAAKMLTEADVPVTVRPLFLGIGASRKTKRWPARNMVEFLDLAVGNDPAPCPQFVICSIADDADWLAEFSKVLEEPRYHRLRRAVAHFHNLSLRNVVAVISQCRGYVGNDSGMKHVAAALGRPTVTVFGPESPHEWHPYPKDVHPLLFMSDLSCRTQSGRHWCAIPECVKEKHRCMAGISAEEVNASVRF